MTTEKLDIVEDLVQIREMVSSTYEELQLTLQKPEEDGFDKPAAIQTTMAAFNLAMGVALKKSFSIAEDPSVILKSTSKKEAVEALAKLTWWLLRIAPFLSNPKQSILIAQSTGATLERLNFDEALRTKEHCGFLFHLVRKFLVVRKSCLEQGQPTEQLDMICKIFVHL